MFVDLCALDNPQGVSASLKQELLVLAVRLGWDCIAVNQPVVEAVTEQDRPTPAISIPDAGSDAALQAAMRVRHSLLSSHADAPLQQLSRLTLCTGDPTTAATALACSAAQAYDILAVQPATETVLLQACTSLDVDIISLDLARKLPFKLAPSALQAAVERGIHFEVLVAPTLRDESGRRFAFANAAALTRGTRGKGVILSSGARQAFELRGPYDVANLGTLFGLTQINAKASHLQSTWCVKAH
eukprot:jgi/Astpho2/8566/Aster-05600